jgi:hypothetical protein
MVAWSPERNKRELDWSHYDDGRAKGHVAFVNPSDFLKATTKNKTTESQISSDAGDLDEQKLKETSQSPFLRVRNGKIFDHEGRHRMSALAAAGHTSVPVILWHDTAQKLQPVDETTLKAQHPNRPALNVTNAIPLHRDYQDQIEDAMSDDRLRFRDGGDVEGYIPHDDKSRVKNLKAFHGKTPKEIKESRWFHGTIKDFGSFNLGRANAIFLTRDSDFANHFAANNAVGHDWDEKHKIWVPREGSGITPNVMPVHVRAEKPFDYENKKHIAALYEKLGPDLIFDPFLAHSMDDVREGHWEAIENPKIQNAIKEMGHDSFYVKESGEKNLGVYDPSQIKSATGNQGTFDPSNPDITKADGGALSDDEDGITAYHGSPHDFDQFDTSKIGTGEGNQSFGHGLYFAGNENVARNYRDRLGRQEETSGETMADQYVIPRHFYQDTSEEELAENMKEAARWSEQQIFDQGKMHYVFDDGSMLIHDDDEVRAVQKHPGHMYEVHINSHPNHMLDWDAPLSEQSEHVKNALLSSGHDFHQMASDMFDGNPEDLRGADIYHWLSGEHEGGLGSPKNVTDHLSEKGIRGIRYLDAGSRGATDKPTRNYVVFDHNNVAVKRKYAQGGIVEEAA